MQHHELRMHILIVFSLHILLLLPHVRLMDDILNDFRDPVEDSIFL